MLVQAIVHQNFNCFDMFLLISSPIKLLMLVSLSNLRRTLVILTRFRKTVQKNGSTTPSPEGAPAVPASAASYEQIRHRLKQSSSEVFPQLTSLKPSNLIKLLSQYTLYGLREAHFFQPAQQSLCKHIPSLPLDEFLLLLRYLHRSYGLYDPERHIFARVNNYIVRLQDLPADKAIRLLNLMSRMKWNGKVFNHAGRLTLKRLTEFNYADLAKGVMLLAERPAESLETLGKVFQEFVNRFTIMQATKMTHQEMAYTYYILFSNYIKDSVDAMRKHMDARNMFGEVLGTSKIPGVQESYETALVLQKQISQSKQSFQQAVVSISPKFTPKELCLLTSTTNPQLLKHLSSLFQESLPSLTPLQLGSLNPKLGTQSSFIAYYDTYSSKMSIGQKLYLLERTMLPQPKLLQLMEEILRNNKDLTEKQQRRVEALADMAAVGKQEVGAWVEEVTERRRQKDEIRLNQETKIKKERAKIKAAQKKAQKLKVQSILQQKTEQNKQQTKQENNKQGDKKKQ